MTLSSASIGIILDHSQTKVLLVKRSDVSVWVLPGGGIDNNESAEDAVVREIKEETGFQVKIQRQTAFYTPINALASPTSVFLCHIESGQAQLSVETQAIAFFALNQLPYTLFPPHHQWIMEGLASEQTIKRKLTEISYFSFMQLFLCHPFKILRYLWTRFIK